MQTSSITRGWFYQGEERQAEEVYAVFHPHTGEKLVNVPDSTPRMMKQAIETAHDTFSATKEMTKKARADLLFAAAAMIQEDKPYIAGIISAEACKPLKAAESEVDRTVQTLQFAGEEAKRLDGEYLSLDAAAGGEGRDAFTIYEPIGVIGAITPFNFPLNLTVHKVAPALAAGNTIIIKPSEQTPLSSLYLAEVLTKAGFPAGAIAVVPGDGVTLGKVLIEHEFVKKISFTGSPRVGKLIKSQVGLKRITLELGSNSPMYVDRSITDLDAVAAKAVQGAFSYNGQVCLSTQRIYVHHEIAKAFKEFFIKHTERLVFGAPEDRDTDVSSLINQESQTRVLAWINEAQSEGATLLTGGKAKANGITPAVLEDVSSESSISCNEVFGPVVLINEVTNWESALEDMNNSDYGLNAGTFTNNLSQAMKMAHGIEAGQVLINDVPTLRFDHMPYGGVKQSGYGREGVKYAIREMTEMKMISINYNL
ncbi:aldehyde dehydrogenase family protein [Alkalicoccus chagannorensis]|uniref:aldehyde dehydrogenase family protein n=1 Tax=Alkalicoccus chagannorensis TaxID=427072 RepID=UPI00040114C2|nr:aldehyde dehydrogenase family protein [Alkalicoccus chagannorensis]